MAFLGGLFNPPTSPSASNLAGAQMNYNVEAARQQFPMQMTGQQTPYGALQWVSDPNSPSGYKAIQSLSPEQQSLLGLQVQGQTGLGTAAAGLGGQLAGLYGQPAQIDPSSMTKQLMDWQTQYMQPYWDQQKSQLEAQLRDQGLTPGSEAFTNSMRGFTEGVGGARNQFFAQAEPTAFSQALQQYQLPLQTMQGLMGGAGPTGPSFVQSPQPQQIQPPDYLGAAQQQYAQQQQQYGNMAQGLFGIPTALAGGWARAGFPGASAALGALA